jgi:hypothetical protein
LILKVPSEDEQSEFTRRYSQDLRKRRKNLRGDDDEAEDEGEKERRNRDSNSRSSTRRQVQFFFDKVVWEAKRIIVFRRRHYYTFWNTYCTVELSFHVGLFCRFQV